MERQVSFVTTQELEDRWPSLSPKEREDAWVREHPTTFVMGIGAPLKSGKPHDGRAPDYDDWALNGDILVWNSVLSHALELSSMGIRVSPESLDRQLSAAGCNDRRALPFHKLLLEGKLPLTMGGGIGQSRVSMYLLGKATSERCRRLSGMNRPWPPAGTQGSFCCKLFSRRAPASPEGESFRHRPKGTKGRLRGCASGSASPPKGGASLTVGPPP